MLTPPVVIRTGLRVLLVVALLAAAAACEQDERRPEGAQQLAWGEATFDWHCARCHAADRSAPEMTSDTLLTSYGDGFDLYELIRISMPLDAPQTLSDRDYLAVTAYLLDREDLLTLPAEERFTEDNAGEVDLGRQPFELEPDPDVIPEGDPVVPDD
jgi:hypothetical protein